MPALRGRGRRCHHRRPRPPGSRRGCRPPACAPSTTSSTSPTTCCSSSASRCTRSISRSSRAGRFASAARRRASASGRSTASTARSIRRCWSLPTPTSAQAVAGVMGGGLSEVSGSDEDHRARKRVLQSEERPPDEQEARAEDGSVGALRARRRRQRRASRASSAPSRSSRKSAPGPRAAAPSTNIPRRSRRGRSSCAARASSGCSGWRFPTPTSSASSRGSVFRFGRTDAGWDVAVPTFRVDVLARGRSDRRGRAALRLRSACRRRFPALSAPPAPSDPRIERDRLVRRVLLAAGCSEALTFSFIDAAAAAQFADERAIVPIGNPLSAQFSVLRPSLLPGLLASVAHNRHRERTDVRLFELGATHDARRRVPARRRGADRQPASSHWSAARRPDRFLRRERASSRPSPARCRSKCTFDGAPLPSYLVRGRAATVSVGGRAIGSVGMLAPAIVASAGLSPSEDVYVAELDLDALDRVATGARR